MRRTLPPSDLRAFTGDLFGENYLYLSHDFEQLQERDSHPWIRLVSLIGLQMRTRKCS